MTTVVAEPSLIKAIVLEALTEAFEDKLPTLIKQVVRKDWLTKEELRQATGWSDRTIQHLRDTRQIPFSQHGRKILYPAEGIELFLRNNQLQPRITKQAKSPKQ